MRYELLNKFIWPFAGPRIRTKSYPGTFWSFLRKYFFYFEWTNPTLQTTFTRFNNNLYVKVNNHICLIYVYMSITINKFMFIVFMINISLAFLENRFIILTFLLDCIKSFAPPRQFLNEYRWKLLIFVEPHRENWFPPLLRGVKRGS